MTGSVARSTATPTASALAAAEGLTVLAEATWPESPDDTAPTPVAGFIVSSFSPLVAELAERCLRRRYDEPPAPPEAAAGTAIVLVSAGGDVASAVHVAEVVDADRRVGPLLFFQSVPNAVAGHVSSRWGLGGPVVCVSPAGEPLAEGLAVAALLIGDGDAAEALIVHAEQAYVDGEPDRGSAVLVARPVATGAAHGNEGR